jgi:hypothetical protein
MTEPEDLLTYEPVDPVQARVDVVDAVTFALNEREEGRFAADLIERIAADLQPEHLDAALDLLVGLSVASRFGIGDWQALGRTLQPPESIKDVDEPESSPLRNVAGVAPETDESWASMDDRGAEEPQPDVASDTEGLEVPADLAAMMATILRPVADNG